MDFSLVFFGLLQLARADRMPGKGQRHVSAAQIIPAAAPFLRAGAVGLRCETVVKEKSRVAFQRAEVIAMRENKGSADKTAGPITATLRLARVQENQVPARLGLRMIVVGG